MTTATEADSYAIALPESWWRVPLDPEGYTEFATGVLGRLETMGATAQARRGTELLLRDVAKQLEDARAVYAALGVSTVETDDGPRIVTASVTMLSATREQIGAPSTITVSALVRALSSTSADGDDAAPADVAPPERVRLPAGDAARLRRHHRYEVHRPGSEVYAESYLIPHDGGQRLLTVQCATPNISLVSSFQDLFAKVVDTVRIFAPGEPTTWDDDSPQGAARPTDGDGSPEEVGGS